MSSIAAAPSARSKIRRMTTREQVADPWGVVELVENHGVDVAEAARRLNIKRVTADARLRVARKVPVAERFYDDPDIEYFHVSSCADMPSALRMMTLRVISERAKSGRSARGDDARIVSRSHHAGSRMTPSRIHEIMDRMDDPVADLRARWADEDRG